MNGRHLPVIFLLLFSFPLLADDDIKFAKSSHFFGVFKRSQGVRTHTFTYENIGDSPVTISHVKASCGCTAMKWSKEPVAPGEQGSVTVRFDPGKFTGYFSKHVSVYTNRSTHPTRLQVSGRVRVNNRLDDEFIHFVGDLRGNKRALDFGDVEMGAGPVSREVYFINVMRDSIYFKISNPPKGITFTQTREAIAAGGNCVLKVTVDPTVLKKWGTQNTALSFKISRKARTEQFQFPIRFAVIDDFSKIKEDGKTPLPAIDLPKEEQLLLQETKAGQEKTLKLTVSNPGKRELILRKIEHSLSYLKVTDFPQNIKPGKSAKISFSYTLPEEAEGGSLIIWNNSPDNYKLTVPVKREIGN